MAKHFYCRMCGCEFEPRPAFIGGNTYCSSCSDKHWDKIETAKNAFDRLPQNSGGNGCSNFANELPINSTTTCDRCGATISHGNYCGSCDKANEREWQKNLKEIEKENKRRQREYEKAMRKI